MINFTIPMADIDTANRTLNPYVCDCTDAINRNLFTMNLRLQYMAILTFSVVVYLATTYRLNESLFKRSVKWALFILIISSAWLFEFAIRSIIWS